MKPSNLLIIYYFILRHYKLTTSKSLNKHRNIFLKYLIKYNINKKNFSLKSYNKSLIKVYVF